MKIGEAKERLDKLIGKGRVHLYKPIQVAEILYRDRVFRDINLSDLRTYRRQSTRWRNAVCPRLVGRKPVLNSRYEDQMFDKGLLSPEALSVLGKENKKKRGLVESYIYHNLKSRLNPLRDILQKLKSANPKRFDLDAFIRLFSDNPHLRRSIDKAYEIIVYALFDTLTKHLNATITLSVDKLQLSLLSDFERFSSLVLGIDAKRLSIRQPARLFRFGATNAADTGLDIWANFGPAIQIKHISLNEAMIADVKQNISADKIVIVCKTAEKEIISRVVRQLGIKERIRGFITEADLVEWYGIATSRKYHNTIGKDALSALLNEFKNEFPLAISSEINAFISERKYTPPPTNCIWRIQ